jgi:hypothetical protein
MRKSVSVRCFDDQPREWMRLGAVFLPSSVLRLSLVAYRSIHALYHALSTLYPRSIHALSTLYPRSTIFALYSALYAGAEADANRWSRWVLHKAAACGGFATPLTAPTRRMSSAGLSLRSHFLSCRLRGLARRSHIATPRIGRHAPAYDDHTNNQWSAARGIDAPFRAPYRRRGLARDGAAGAG